MKVEITDFAKESLRSITTFYKDKGYRLYAARIQDGLYSVMEELEAYPEMGRLEKLLTSKGLGHRFVLIEKYFKVIHRTEGQIVYITDIFDTRQEPKKMKKRV